MNIKYVALAAFAVFGFSSAANAAVTYDYTIPGPGWYAGNGNPNGAFTDSSNGAGLAIDLRAKNRQDGNVITPVGNVYYVLAGPQVGNPALAIWNYEFGITCAACDTGVPDTMMKLLGRATITISDLTAGTSSTVPMTHWLDDDVWSGGAEHDGDSFFPGAIMAQNSENMAFADNPFTQAGNIYNMYDNHTYSFLINLKDRAGNSLLSDEMFVQVPEPLTLSLFGAGVVGAAALRRRKKSQKA